jgi:hypothetical protein
MDVFETIAERRIREAMEQGAFENLEGRGRPFDFSEERNVPSDLRTVYRVLKNAGCVPPEVELRREVRGLQDLLPGIRDERELRDAARVVNEKIAALNLMTARSGSHSIRNEVAQVYVEKLVDRLRQP